ncbi:MAG TPA: membrane dipeptidase [Noviherbaspirillum sp.]|nr:membrane dipeptidase [Noviherbaspirillum sp.]
MAPVPRVKRRRLLQAALSCLAASPWQARAQQVIPLADMHSHYGMITRRMADSGFAEELRSQSVSLAAWKIIADSRWIRPTQTGIEQVSEPKPGELSAHFHHHLDRMRAYLGAHRLNVVLTPADVDRAHPGEPAVVIASEGADFLEGRVEALDTAYAKGLRHLQLVHYIRTPVGDFQTKAPVHNGLSRMGQELVRACNDMGILVDLAHCTAPAVEQALELSRKPVVWSHGWVDGDGGSWQDPYGYLRRRLSLRLARRIAAEGGVVGLWGLALSRPGLWPVAAGDTLAYAREIVKLVDAIGADHVAFGSDIEGVGSNWVLNDYGHLRKVVAHLQDLKLPASVIEKVAYANYARVLRTALDVSGK